MGNAENKKVIVAAAVGIVTASIVAAYAYHRTTKNCTENEKSEQLAEPKISKESTVKLLEEMVMHMSNVMMQLSQLEQKVRKDAAAAGQMLPEEELAGYLGKQFEDNLNHVSNELYAKHSCTEEQAQHAIAFYGEDEQVKNMVFKLTQIIDAVSGEQPKAMTNADGSAPEDLSLDTLVAMMEDTFELMGKAMDATCQEVLDQNIPEDKRMEHVQKIYTQKADEATTTVFNSFNVTREAFHNATIKFGQDKTFMEKIQQLQVSQAVRFKEAATPLGIEI